MFSRSLTVLATVIFWVLTGCTLDLSPRPDTHLTVMTWNVENLFDDIDDGTEYPEFDPQKGWSRQDFWRRCEALARVVRDSVGGGPDVLALEEVESPRALEVLNSRFLADLGYKFTFITPAEFPGMRTALLSRFPLVRTAAHFPQKPGEGGLRPILEAEWDLGGRRLVVLANHWKSRIPSGGATEPLRAQSAAVLAARLAELQAREDHPLVLALGDFNTSLELSRPWPEAAMSGSPAHTAIGGVDLYDEWVTTGEPRGSYFYKGKWDCLDHIFVLNTSLAVGDWVPTDFHPVRYSPKPLPWSPRTPNGVSDHFPLLLTLVRHA